MAIGTRLVTLDEFLRISAQPDHADRRLEYVGGELHEVVSNNYASQVAARILIKLGAVVEADGLGHLTGADGGYEVSGERYIPDVGFIRAERQPAPSHATWNPLAPDLAVEVLSPTDDPAILRLKLSNYLAAGVTVWVVDPAQQRIEVHAPGQRAQHLRTGDTLSGGDTLPEFSVPVDAVFP